MTALRLDHLVGVCVLVAMGAVVLGCRAPAQEAAPVPLVEEGFFPGADGLQLFYRKVGTGPDTAVYLHGGPASMADGGYEFDEFAEGRTLIAFDQRSGGKSQLVNDPAKRTAEYFIRDLEALQQHFQLGRFTLIGHSWGSMLAAMYTARHPDQVKRLLLIVPGPPNATFLARRVAATDSFQGPERVQRLGALADSMMAAPDSLVPVLCRERNRIVFRFYLNDVAALDRMRVGYCDWSAAALRHELTAGGLVLASLSGYDFLPDLAKMTQPALVVEGAETRVPLDATRAWATALPNGRLLLFPGASHMIWLEGDVPAAKRALRQFLDGEWPEGAETLHP